MTLLELQELVHAGFTKEEILTLTGINTTPAPTPTEGVTKVEAVETEAVKEEPKSENIKAEENKVDAPPQQNTNVNFAPMMTDVQIEKLAQMLNRGTATIDLPQPRNIEETLSDHFKNLMLGKE